MKNSVLFIFFCLFSLIGFSQGTLQFNQVKLVSAQETVPANKVWKIESVMSGELRYPTAGSTLPSNSRFIAVNGSPVCIYEEYIAAAGLGFNGCCGGGSWMSNTGQSVNSTQTHFVQVSRQNTELPIWLPAGATLAAGTNVTSISVIEFNIVP